MKEDIKGHIFKRTKCHFCLSENLSEGIKSRVKPKTI